MNIVTSCLVSLLTPRRLAGGASRSPFPPFSAPLPSSRQIREYRDSDWSEWLRMSMALFPQHAPVGYVEAWYVDPDVRRTGYGRALLAAAEAWALRRGCREMASDAQLGNAVSHAARPMSV